MKNQKAKTGYGYACFSSVGLVLFLVLAFPEAGQGQDYPRSLVILETQELGPLYTAMRTIVANGGIIDHVYPPNAFIAYVPPKLLNNPDLIPHAGLITQDLVDETSLLKQWGESARIAGYVWNTTVQGIAHAAASTPAKGVSKMPVGGDAFYAQEDKKADSVEAMEIGQAPSDSQTSEFLIGSSTVAIIFPESNGQIDPSTEEWSAARQDTAIAKIKDGLQWWKDNSNAPTNLAFVYEIRRNVQTKYEGITRSLNDHANLVVPDIMATLGYTSGSHSDRVRSFLNDRRTALGTDWAFAAFVFDSMNDADGEFPDGRFAYAYLNGPYMVMTYDNNGWGIDRMDLVTAHENGHIWGARDEYASSNCTDTQTSGYLNIANTNCENGDPATEDSIMRGHLELAWANHSVSTPARQAVGWRDSDSDGKELYDPVDTTPTVTLNAHSPDPTTDSTPTFTGSAQDQPFTSPTHTSTTINTVKVQWRVNGGAWQDASPDDGVFDWDSENFSFTSAALSTGTYLFEARAINSVGNVSTIKSDTLTITQNFTVTITKQGGGSGTVSSNPSGINCGSDCSEVYTDGTVIVLTALPADGSAFTGWSGGGCSGTGACMITLKADTTVTATFATGFTLTVTKAGSGTGTVSSDPDGISCGLDCKFSYASGSSVTLSAKADSGSSFSGWSGGGCSGTSTCTVALNANTTIKATFSKTYTDDPLTSQVTIIKAAHITELRKAIDNLRSHHNLKAFSYTDSSLSAGATKIKAVHVTELRTALDGVYDAQGKTRPSYTDPTITAGQTTVKKAHVAEIRSAIKDAE